MPEKAGHQKPSLSPSIEHINTNEYKWNTPSAKLLNVNHISMHNSCVSRVNEILYFMVWSRTFLYQVMYTVDELRVLMISQFTILSSLQ